MAYAFTRQAGPKGPDKTHYDTFYGPLVLCHGPEIWKKKHVLVFLTLHRSLISAKSATWGKAHSLSQFSIPFEIFSNEAAPKG